MLTPAAIPAAAADDKGAPSSAVKAEDLSRPGGVVGRLGVPLGKVVTVVGEIIDGRELRVKSLEGTLLLQATSVDGRKLATPCALSFQWLMPAPAKKLSGAVRLVGYESGRFAGVPPEAFSHIKPVASPGFHFESVFVVVKAL
jgi:hypothetical protein